MHLQYLVKHDIKIPVVQNSKTILTKNNGLTMNALMRDHSLKSLVINILKIRLTKTVALLFHVKIYTIELKEKRKIRTKITKNTKYQYLQSRNRSNF